MAAATVDTTWLVEVRCRVTAPVTFKVASACTHLCARTLVGMHAMLLAMWSLRRGDIKVTMCPEV